MINSSYCIHPRFLTLRDKPRDKTPLLSLFQDSHTLFRIRVQKLGSLSKITTREESDALRIMLEALIVTKETLQNQV
jgi:hypothetical protein